MLHNQSSDFEILKPQIQYGFLKKISRNEKQERETGFLHNFARPFEM
jgi:hypothetical protein